MERTQADSTPEKRLAARQSESVPIDSSRVENTIRRFAVGRRNWLFADQAHGVEASAVLYSIIATAQANELEPMHNLHFLLNCMEHFSPAETPWQNPMPTPAIRRYAVTIDKPWQMT